MSIVNCYLSIVLHTMSPHLIIILMLSSVTLLLVLLFAVRKRTKKTTAISPEQAPLPLKKQQEQEPELDLSSLDFSRISVPNNPSPPSVPYIPYVPSPPSPPSPLDDIIDMVSRYKFFQGKNLEAFSSLLRANNLNGIEIMIREKFEAQKKENAEMMAKEVTTKLIGAVIQ